MSLTNVSQPVFRGLSRMRLVDFMPVARVGAREHIAPLDPRVHPHWKTTFRVDPTALCTARRGSGPESEPPARPSHPFLHLIFF